MMENKQKIPEGWSVKRLGDISQTFSGGTPLTGTPAFYENGTIPFIRSGEIYQDYTYIYITEKGLIESAAKMVNKGDLLFALYGANSGDVAISKMTGAINQAILCIRLKEDNIRYLENVFINFKFCILNKYLQGGQGNLSAEIVKSLIFLFPPLPEQEKIAEILGTWDDAIEKLGKLIEAKKLQKKSLIQKLLTSKHRLKGFTEPWREVRLGNLGATYTGLSGKNKEDFGKGSFYISYMNIYQNSKVDLKQLDLVDVHKWETQNTIKYGDIFFTTSSETPDEVGFSSVLLSEVSEDIYLNSFCFGFRLHNFDNLIPDFAAYMFRSLSVRKIMFKLAQGATRFNLSKNELMKQKILIPLNTAEQKAIADILSTADEEIDVLNKKLEALKEQKKGLMQQLLTGQIRVKVN